MNDTIKQSLKNNSTWMRILYMLIFVIIFNIVEFLLAVMVIFQLLILLVTGEKNTHLVSFGGKLSQYAYKMLQFLTFNSEYKPFPFADWDDVALEASK